MVGDSNADGVKAYLLEEIRKHPLSTSFALLFLQGITMVFAEYPWLKVVGGSLVGLAATLPTAAALRVVGHGARRFAEDRRVRRRIDRALPSERAALSRYYTRQARIVEFPTEFDGIQTLADDGVIRFRGKKDPTNGLFEISEDAYRHVERQHAVLFPSVTRIP